MEPKENPHLSLVEDSEAPLAMVIKDLQKKKRNIKRWADREIRKIDNAIELVQKAMEGDVDE